MPKVIQGTQEKARKEQKMKNKQTKTKEIKTEGTMENK